MAGKLIEEFVVIRARCGIRLGGFFGHGAVIVYNLDIVFRKHKAFVLVCFEIDNDCLIRLDPEQEFLIADIRDALRAQAQLCERITVDIERDVIIKAGGVNRDGRSALGCFDGRVLCCKFSGDFLHVCDCCVHFALEVFRCVDVNSGFACGIACQAVFAVYKHICDRVVGVANLNASGLVIGVRIQILQTDDPADPGVCHFRRCFCCVGELRETGDDDLSGRIAEVCVDCRCVVVLKIVGFKVRLDIVIGVAVSVGCETKIESRAENGFVIVILGGFCFEEIDRIGVFGDAGNVGGIVCVIILSEVADEMSQDGIAVFIDGAAVMCVKEILAGFLARIHPDEHGLRRRFVSAETLICQFSAAVIHPVLFSLCLNIQRDQLGVFCCDPFKIVCRVAFIMVDLERNSEIVRFFDRHRIREFQIDRVCHDILSDIHGGESVGGDRGVHEAVFRDHIALGDAFRIVGDGIRFVCTVDAEADIVL